MSLVIFSFRYESDDAETEKFHQMIFLISDYVIQMKKKLTRLHYGRHFKNFFHCYYRFTSTSKLEAHRLEESKSVFLAVPFQKRLATSRNSLRNLKERATRAASFIALLKTS